MIAKRGALGLLVAALSGICLVPIGCMLALAFSASRFPGFPWQGWSARWFEELLADGGLGRSVVTSAEVAVIAAAVAVAIGVPAGYGFARSGVWGYRFLMLLTIPAVIPPLVFGFAFLTFARALGLARTVLGVGIAHSVVFSPIVASALFQRCRALDPRPEYAAREMGASSLRVLLAVVVGQVRHTVLIAGSLVFLLSWDEYIIAWFVSGFAKTYPVRVRDMLESTMSPEIAAAGTVIGIASVLLAGCSAFGKSERTSHGTH